MRLARCVLVLVVTLALSATACSPGSPGTDAGSGNEETFGPWPAGTFPRVTFADVERDLRERVEAIGSAGASLVVVQDGAVLAQADVGSVDPTTVVPVGEAARWLTAVVVATLVDDGLVAWDDPVTEYLPGFDAGAVVDPERKGGITLRHLLSHTSGLPAEVDCTTTPAPPTVPSTDPASSAAGSRARPWPQHPCDAAIAAATLVDAPGEQFVVSAAGYHVLARLVEVVTGRSWAEAVATRLTGPLAMTATTVEPASATGPDATSDGASDGTVPLGSSADSTPADLGRFLAMVLAGGVGADGTRLVSAELLAEMEHDQTTRLDTHLEPWVGWTGIPTFGLGVWRDRLRGDGAGAAVSAAGAGGTYPWIDRPRNVWGVLVMDDRVSPPGDAVRFSAGLVQGSVPPAVETEGRAVYRVPPDPGEAGGDVGTTEADEGSIVVTDASSGG